MTFQALLVPTTVYTAQLQLCQDLVLAATSSVCHKDMTMTPIMVRARAPAPVPADALSQPSPGKERKGTCATAAPVKERKRAATCLLNRGVAPNKPVCA